MRQGLPVNERERTVSRRVGVDVGLPAGPGCSRTPRPSATASPTTRPGSRAPARRRSARRCRCRRRRAPGRGATALTTWGHRTIEPTSPQWPPPSPPWAMMMSTSASACLRAWYGEPHSAATLRPSAWMWSIMSGGGVPRALAISVIFGWLQRDLDLRGGGGLGPAEELQRVVVLALLQRDAVVDQQLAGEVEVALRAPCPGASW